MGEIHIFNTSRYSDLTRAIELCGSRILTEFRRIVDRNHALCCGCNCVLCTHPQCETFLLYYHVVTHSGNRVDIGGWCIDCSYKQLAGVSRRRSVRHKAHRFIIADVAAAAHGYDDVRGYVQNVPLKFTGSQEAVCELFKRLRREPQEFGWLPTAYEADGATSRDRRS